MKTIPLHRVATVIPFTQFLEDLGIPVDRELRRAGLPAGLHEDPDFLIPSYRYWNFVAQTADREGIDDLGFQVGEQAGANAADPNLVSLLRRSPTLYAGLTRFCDIATSEITRAALWLDETGKGYVKLCYRTSFGTDHRAHEHFEWYGLLAALAVIRVYTGARWYPRRIGLATKGLPTNDKLEHLPGTRFLNRQEHAFITIERRLLVLPPAANGENGRRKFTDNFQRPPVDGIDSLKQVLRGYLRDGTPSISMAAEIANYSVRTLQRRLSEDQLTFRQLLEQVRFEYASKLLADPYRRMSDISFLLGYSEPAHFTRAFRRIAGIAPREYRKNMRSGNVEEAG